MFKGSYDITNHWSEGGFSYFDGGKLSQSASPPASLNSIVRCFVEIGKMSDFEDEEEIWELSPDNSHPNAVAVLTDEFYWDCGDDNSPFGNDTGADTLEHFREWREEHSTENPIEFLDQLLGEWDVTNDFWDVTDVAEVQKLRQQDEFSFSLRDEAVIALAFGQLLLEGKIDTEPKQRALSAIERQSLPAIVKFWEEFAEERAERLKTMKSVLEEL